MGSERQKVPKFRSMFQAAAAAEQQYVTSRAGLVSLVLLAASRLGNQRTQFTLQMPFQTGRTGSSINLVL